MEKIVLATKNKGKAAELRKMLGADTFEVLSLADYPEIGDIPETGDTFEANALIKAREVARLTGLTALADDSGLAVDYLNGAPGVYSARYSGEGATDAANNAKLIEAMRGCPEGQRGGAFVCVIAAVRPNGRELTVRGEWRGVILRELRGANGFGYDPLFFDPELGVASAEMSPETKNSRSHRGLALRKLLASWPDFLA
jgi:XTP/dITP diphosphohydrolase